MSQNVKVFIMLDMINNLVVMRRGNLVQNRIYRIANPESVFFRIANPKEQASSTLIGICNPDVKNCGFIIHMKADRIANPGVFACGLQIRKSLERCVYFRITNPKEPREEARGSLER